MPLILGANSASGGYTVKNSLRFNSGSSDYLNRTPAGAGSLTNWTWSGWIKRSTIGAEQSIFFGDSSGTNYGGILFQSSDTLDFVNRPSGGGNARLLTTQVFRDVSAWYHIVVVWNTSSATSGDRLILYVNGVRVTSFSTETYPSQNTSSVLNTAIAHEVGAYIQANGGSFGAGFRGYMSDVFFIDGQALTPSSFGQTDTTTGIWIPKAYTGTYGTNGFYLKFANSASLGTDSSGNGNNFTVNNLTSVDQSTDTPTNNFCTLNPLINHASGSLTFSEGNLKITGTGNAWVAVTGSLGIKKGKWYYETKWTTGTDPTNSPMSVGWEAINNIATGGTVYYSGLWWKNTGTLQGGQDQSGFSPNTTGETTYTAGDILGLAVDYDNNTLTCYKNGTVSSINAFNYSSYTTNIRSSQGYEISSQTIFYASGGNTIELNFGSPSYTANGYTDGAGYGNFSYAVPSGYYALCSANLAKYG